MTLPTIDMPGIAPIARLTQIDLDSANSALIHWGHAMGACRRPNADLWCHALWHHDQIVAVTVTASLIRETAAGFSRNQAIELARLCADRPTLCRVALRLWREFVFSDLSARRGWRWAISYQDNQLHTGGTYRFDGWVRLGRSRSGTDKRSGRSGRDKTIWGWCADAGERCARGAA